jgi:signal recognition particle subunit SRP68
MNFSSLERINTLHNEYGIKHGDYERYRRYCSKKIHKLRKLMNFTNKKGKQQYCRREVSVESLQSLVEELKQTKKEELCVMMILCEVERCWASAMEEKEGTSKNSSKKHNVIKKLKKAVKFGKIYVNLSETILNISGKLEVQAYVFWLEGLLKFEMKQWNESLDKLRVSKSIYEKLSESLSQYKDLCSHKLEEIDPIIRYCLYNIQLKGSGELREIMNMQHSDVLLESKIEELLEDVLKKKLTEESNSIKVGNQVLEIKNIKIRMALLKLEEEEKALASSKMMVPTSFEKALVAFNDAESALNNEILISKGKPSSDDLSLILTSVKIKKFTLFLNRDWSLFLDGKDFGNKLSDCKEPLDSCRLLWRILKNLEESLSLESIDNSQIETLLFFFKGLSCILLASQRLMASGYSEALGLYESALTYIRKSVAVPKINDDIIQLVGFEKHSREADTFLIGRKPFITAMASLSSGKSIKNSFPPEITPIKSKAVLFGNVMLFYFRFGIQ